MGTLVRPKVCRADMPPSTWKAGEIGGERAIMRAGIATGVRLLGERAVMRVGLRLGFVYSESGRLCACG
jgi:hypothetical protein